MSKKIVYLLGAGASANALPVVGALKERFESFCVHFEKYLADFERPKEKQDLAKKNHLQLVLNLKNHYTIDTYARKLYLQSQLNGGDMSTYNLLKKYLSAFFTYEQINIEIVESCNDYISNFYTTGDTPSTKLPLIENVLKNFDYRYDSFLASVLEINNNLEIQLPENISIVSWNYDYQIEKAFINFSNDGLDAVQNMLNVFGGFNHKVTTNNERYSLIKLNGTAGFIDVETRKNVIDFKNDTLTKEIFELFEDALLSRRNKFHNGVRFAWENESISKDAIEMAYKKIREADIIVIVGYSFPYFNREVDRKIFKGLLETGKKAIYLQGPEDTIESTANRFKAIFANYGIEKHTEIDQFLIPNEF